MVYPGKKDWWAIVLLGLVGAVELVVGGTLVGVGLLGGPWPVLVAGAGLLAVATLVLWVLYGTRYEIGETSLVVRCGPFRKTVPLDAIEDVVPAGLWSAVPEWNFSLTIRGLRVRYRKPSGRLSWPIRIGPEDRAAFLLDLSERLPDLEVKDDGSLHRPAPA
jgi:hypothetical protein